MSAPPSTRVSDVAARQVEQIVGAAQEAAEQIRQEARREVEDLRRGAEGEGEAIREAARREGEQELNRARKEAILLTQDARRDAEGILADANAESAQIREQTQRAVEGRTAVAEQAAAEVLAEARALSGGLRQLGRSLEDQADRILRDVQAAHKRMQADLRVGGGALGTAPAAGDDDPAPPRAQPSRPEERAVDDPKPSRRREPSRAGRRPNPFDDLEVPSWER